MPVKRDNTAKTIWIVIGSVVVFFVIILGILAAIAIPAYLGAQEKAKKTIVEREAQVLASDLNRWMTAAKKANTDEGGLNEVDTDCNDIVDEADMTNSQLAFAGIVSAYLNARPSMNQVSPWDPSKSLWVNGGIADNQSACDAIGAANPGQITICYSPAEDQTVEFIFISANDSSSKLIQSEILSGVQHY
jgi:Tfp pilus assembly protein PilE